MSNETLDNVWRRLGGRKLISLILGLAATVVLAFYDKLDGNAVTVILGLTTAFSTGNVLEHMMQGRRNGVVPAEPASTTVGDADEPEKTD